MKKTLLLIELPKNGSSNFLPYISTINFNIAYIKVKENRRDYGDENRDKYLTLFRDYLEIHQDSLSEKKTFFLTENLYKTIKQLSKDKSMKINVLVNLLLTMGLDHYGIGIKQNSEED
ncbi:hypothetical protein [Bacillus xiapuensis]|uniref:hypothetical protein n=1 Tax=Bacillus xiapuensis TaxID=2014075 RepID=UPI000C24F32D|nr:hypothetical protein [Bacillus xiapuensis]